MTPVDPADYYPGYLVIPATTETRGQTGAWDGVGQTRTLMLADGGSVVETLTTVDAPHRFEYRLTQFQKIFKTLVDHAEAQWLFEPEGAGTRVRWTYTFLARPGWGLPLAAIVKLFWGPYMRRVLPGIVAAVPKSA